MPIRGNAMQVGPWSDGVVYSIPAEELAPTAVRAMQNGRIGIGGQWSKRNGFSEYISGAISGTPTLTMIAQNDFSASSQSLYIVAGTKVYEDVSGTWTDRTGGQTITAADDNVFQTANAAGTLCFTNGVNPPLKVTAATGNAALLDVDARFTWSDSLDYWDTRIWHGNTSAGTDRVYYSDAGDIETIGATSFFTVDADITGVKGFRNLMAVHTENGIWGFFPTGNSTTPYSQQKITSKGTISNRSIIITSLDQMLFMRKDGVYEWDPNESQTPRKISVPLDGSRYWDTINKSRLALSHAVEYPDKDEVWFFVPYGTSQTTMNHVLIWNYRQRIWYGPDLNFTRNCAALVGAKPHAAGHSDGLLFIHDNTTNDNGTAIDAWFETAATPPAGGSNTVRWLFARHHYDAQTDSQPSIQVTQLSTEVPTRVDAFAAGAAGDAIGTTFVIATSRLGGISLLESEDTNLWGYSASCLLRYRNAAASETFTMRRAELHYKPVGLHRKESSGIE